MKANFYKTTAWRRKREKILRRDRYKCQLSKRYGKNIEAATVHHIYPLDQYPQFGLCDWNLISVSSEVNNKLHNRLTGELTKLGLELMQRTEIPNNIFKK